MESAGPPLICHPFEIGDARSLAFGNGAFDGQKGYKPREVVGDTLKLLKTERSVIVRTGEDSIEIPYDQIVRGNLIYAGPEHSA